MRSACSWDGLRVYNGSRVVRGGSWNNNAENLRSAARNNNNPDDRNNNIGWRCSNTGWPYQARQKRGLAAGFVPPSSRCVRDQSRRVGRGGLD
mgnify:CR=1 FL=1